MPVRPPDEADVSATPITRVSRAVVVVTALELPPSFASTTTSFAATPPVPTV